MFDISVTEAKSITDAVVRRNQEKRLKSAESVDENEDQVYGAWVHTFVGERSIVLVNFRDSILCAFDTSRMCVRQIVG
jgi:hypothetical protein